MTIIKLKSGKYRLVSKKKQKNLGTFPTHTAAAKHEGQVEYFKSVSDSSQTKERDASMSFDFEPNIAVVDVPRFATLTPQEFDFETYTTKSGPKQTKYCPHCKEPLSFKKGEGRGVSCLQCEKCGKKFRNKKVDFAQESFAARLAKGLAKSQAAPAQSEATKQIYIPHKELGFHLAKGAKAFAKGYPSPVKRLDPSHAELEDGTKLAPPPKGFNVSPTENVRPLGLSVGNVFSHPSITGQHKVIGLDDKTQNASLTEMHSGRDWSLPYSNPALWGHAKKEADFANPNCPTCGKFTKYYHSIKHGRVLGCKACGKSYKHRDRVETTDRGKSTSEEPQTTTEKGLEASPKKVEKVDLSTDFSAHTPGNLYTMPKYPQPFKLSKIVGNKAYMTHPKLGPASISMSNLGKMSQVNPPKVPVLSTQAITKNAETFPHLSLNDDPADFAGDIGNIEDTTDAYSGDTPEARRNMEKNVRLNQKRDNTKKYETNENFRDNANKVRDVFTKLRAAIQDPKRNQRIYNGAAMTEHHNALLRALPKHSAAIAHGYALANPIEMEGEYGYPTGGHDAVARHYEHLHNDYWKADHPDKEIPPLEESTVLPPMAIGHAIPRGDMKRGLAQIMKQEKQKGPFITHLLDRMPEHFKEMDIPNGPRMPWADRLEKLRSGSLDKAKMEKLLESMHGEHGSVTADQLMNHVLPSIDYKIPSDNERDNMDTRYGSIKPGHRDAMLRSEKMQKILEEQAAEKASRIAAKASKGPEASGAGKVAGTPLATGGASTEPTPGMSRPKEIMEKLRPMLSPGSRFKLGESIYTPLAHPHITVDKQGRPAMAFRRVNRDPNEDAIREKKHSLEKQMHGMNNLSPEFKKLQEELGKLPQIGKDVKIPWEDMEHFVHNHRVA